MIVDTNIQALPNIWGTRVGADIGGKVPSAYGITQGTPCNLSAALFRTSGEPYSDWLAYSERWIPPSASLFVMDFDLWLDGRVGIAAQCLEFDLKSRTFNFSSQLNIQAGWLWQVDKAGIWVNAGPVTPLAPYVKHHFTIAGKFSATVYSPISVTIDGVVHAVPAALQNQPATNTDWAAGVANVQIQQDANVTGGEFQTQIDGLNLSWT